MAANDEFPRGWTFNVQQNASGVAPTITLPGQAGIAHVLTGFKAKWSHYNLSANSQHIWSVTFAVPTVLTGILVIPLGATEAFDEVEYADLSLAAAAGQTLSAFLDAGPGAGEYAELTISGHDI